MKNLSSILANYQDHLAVSGKATTQKTAASHCRTLVRLFGDGDAATLHPWNIRAFKRARTEEGVKPASFNGALRVLRAAIALAVEEGELAAVPCRIRLEKVERPLPSTLTDPEFEALLAAARLPWLQLVLLLARDAGLRHSEIFRLTQADILYRGGSERTYLRITETKGARARLVPINLRLRRALDAYLEQVPRGAARLFERTEASQEVRGAFRAAGLYDRASKPGLHALRRTWATRALERGVSLRQVMVWAGWQDVATAQRYMGITADGAEAAAALLDGDGS